MLTHNFRYIFVQGEAGDLKYLSAGQIKEIKHKDHTVSAYGISIPGYAEQDWSLETCLSEMKKLDVNFLPVKNNGNQLIGVISIENLFIAIQEYGWGN